MRAEWVHTFFLFLFFDKEGGPEYNDLYSIESLVSASYMNADEIIKTLASIEEDGDGEDKNCMEIE